MSAKKTEILKLEKSLRVKKKFGNSSEDKVILSFAAAFALLAVFFITMETVENNIPAIEKATVSEILSGDMASTNLEPKKTEELASIKEESAATEEVATIKKEPVTTEEVVTIKKEPVTTEEVVTIKKEPVTTEEVATVKEEPVTKKEVATVKEEPVTKKEVVTVKEEPTINEIKPSFDLVRVEEDGSAIIAGSAKPNSEVRLLVDGKELEVVEADSSGTFAILTTIPSGKDPLELQLEDTNDNTIKSNDTVLVIPNKVDGSKAPKIVIAEASGNIIVQDQNELAPTIQPLSLDTINYAASGDVILAGRASSEQIVRIYVDNKPVVLGEVTDGKWHFEIPNIEEGIYTLRVDAINDKGKVVDRVESPFQRVILEMQKGQATIQPGFTLWKLAELKYGFGMRYVQIFEANRNSIKDPDLIYPGQVFKIPES
ncbi:LysM peptidoglycan-binding domain-containing protein [Amylibacter sp.]|nr:LysM peptidoglycan-binding domain-containing protein [Amylibacter sp.]